MVGFSTSVVLGVENVGGEKLSVSISALVIWRRILYERICILKRKNSYLIFPCGERNVSEEPDVNSVVVVEGLERVESDIFIGFCWENESVGLEIEVATEDDDDGLSL